MEPQQLTRETLVRRHQLRGSVLPVLTLAYNRRRQHLLTGDEQALRLFSTRKELAVLWLDPRSPSPIYIVHHAPRDVYIVAYDDEPSKHADASTVQILHASLAPLLRYKPHDDFLASLVIHTSGIVITSGEQELKLWRLESDTEVSHVCTLNEHASRGAMHVLHASSDVLLGAVDATVWVWRLGDTMKDVIEPRLALCWEAGGRIMREDPPAITSLLHVGGGRVVVGLDDGVILIWMVPALNHERGPPEALACVAAHVHDPQNNDDAKGVFELSGLEDQGNGRFEFFSCGGLSRSVKHWLVGSSQGEECNQIVRNGSQHHPSVVELTAKHLPNEPAPAEDDEYAAWLQSICRATPMRLILMELSMNDEAVARRTLIAACSGGLVTLYEVHAPAWHAALCADRVLDLRRGLLLDDREHCVVALTDGGHVEALHAEGHCLRVPPPAPEILAKANKLMSAARSKDKRPPGKRLQTGRAALVGIGRSALQGDRVSLGWLPDCSSIVVGRSDGILEVVEPDWDSSLRDRAIVDPATNSMGTASVSRIDGKGPITRVCPLPSKNIVVTGDADGFLKLWNMGSKKCVWAQQAHTSSISALASGVLADHRGFPKKLKGWEDPQTPRRSYATLVVIASASGDGVVRLWRAKTSTLVIAGYFVAQGSVTALCVAQASLGEAQTFVGFDSGLIEAWPIDAEQLRGEEEPKDLDRGARGGHLQEVTSLDALPSSAFVLSASLDRSLALWKAIQGADTLQLQRCIVLGHSIMSAILVRSRQGLDAVLADGARVARVSLAEDPQDQSIVRERSVATPHKSMKEVSVSTENDTVLTASRTAARLTLDVPRLFDESGAATPFSAQPQLSVEEAPWLTKASPEMPWKRPRSVADRPIISAEARPQSGAGEYLFEGRRVQEEPSAESDEVEQPISPIRREDLPSQQMLLADESLRTAFHLRDFGKGFVNGAALPAILKNWWPIITPENVEAASSETSVFDKADEEALQWLGPEDEDEDYDPDNMERFRRKRADKLATLQQNRRRGASITYEQLCDVAAHLCRILNDTPMTHAPCLDRGGGGWSRTQEKKRCSVKKYKDLARVKRRKVYADWGEAYTIEETQFSSLVAPDAPLPTPYPLRAEPRIPTPATPARVPTAPRQVKPPAEVPEVFDALFTDPRLKFARALSETGSMPNKSEPLAESTSMTTMPPRVCMKEARKVIEAHAEELSAAHTSGREPNTFAASCYALFRQSFGPRQIAEAHVVAFLDSLFVHARKAPSLLACAQLFGVDGYEAFPEGASVNYIDALAWLRDRAFLYGDIPSDVDVVYEAAANDGLCYLSASRRACASAARQVCSSPVVASAVVRELASLKGLRASPYGHWDEPVDAEAFALILTSEIVRGDAVAARCASTLFALEREERIVASRHGPQSKVDDLQWSRDLQSLRDLLLRFVAQDTSRTGVLSGSDFGDCMRGGTTGWAQWPSPTFINPVDDSLLSDNELSLKQIVRTYSDPLDQQVCYLDFWAMLWVDSTLHKRLPPLHALYSIACEQLIGIDEQMGSILRTYCSYVGVPKSSPVFVRSPAKKSQLATLFPGQLQVSELVNFDKRPSLLPGTLTISRPATVASEELIGDTAGASRAATAHSRRRPRAKPEKPSVRKMNPGVTLRAEGVPLFMSDVSEQAAPQLSPPKYETARPVQSLSRSMAKKEVGKQLAWPHPTVKPGQHRSLATYTYIGDPFYEARQLGQQPSSKQLQFKSALEWQAKLGERGEHPPYSIRDEMLRVESTAGLYNALGKGVSPVRFLPPDEVARLKADLEKKRRDGLAATRKKQRAAGQPVAPGPAPAVHIPGMTPPGTATKKQREDMARLLEEQMRARRAALADEEERRRQAELERLEAERLAALEAERLAEEARERARVEAELEALRLQREEEERAERQRLEAERAIAERLERERIEREQEELRKLEAERLRIAAEKERQEAEKRLRQKRKREEQRREKDERMIMEREEHLSHELRNLVREEARLAEELRLKRLEEERLARLEAEERSMMASNEEEGTFIRKQVEEERLAEEARLAEIARLEREAFLKQEMNRESHERAQMQAAEDYERDYMWQLAEEERIAKEKADELRARLDAEGRMREENERAAAELAKLKARNMAGMFRAVEQNISDQRTKKVGLAFKGKLMGKVAARRKAAEEEARRKEAEAEELARQMALAEEEERERLAAEKARLEREAEEARKRAEEEAKPKVRPVFGCQFAFSEDLRFDPFSEEQRPAKAPIMGPAAVELQKSLDVFGEEGMAETSLPDSVQRIFRESRGEKLEYDDAQFHVKDRTVYEADVVVPEQNDWRKYFQRRFEDDFADRDKVDKALLVKSDQSQAERDKALEKVLAQSARLYASLGTEKAESLLNGKTVQDASRTFAEVMGSDANVQFAKYSLDLGDANLLQPDESKPLTWFRVEHGSVPRKGSALYNFTIDHNGAVATIMLVCIKGDADLLVAHGRIPTLQDSDWHDTSLRQEKRVCVQPDHRSYRVGKYGVAVRSASKEPCAFAIYACCTGLMANGDESATLARVEPITRRLKVLAEMPASDLVEDFAAALEDATNRVENELALEKAIKEGKKASEIEDDMVRGSVQDQRKAFREQAKALSMSFSGEVEEPEECVPAPAPGSDTLEAKAEAQASMEAWNVSLDELNNPENDEDAVAFEKLMYRMGLAHIKAEDQEAMKPLAVDNAHAPLAPLVKRKKKGKRRRRRRSVSPDRGETIEELDARWTIARGSDAWKSQVKATVAPRVDPMTLATPKPMRYHLLIDDKRYDHKPPPKSPTTGKRPTIPYSIRVTSASTHARRL